MTFAPMVDVAKDARWGRISECAGEDTLLNALYGSAKVKGFQGSDLTRHDALAACVKHFAAYGAAEAGKDYNRVDISDQRLFEDYLLPFKTSIQAGARAVMPAFNDINGTPCSVNRWLLTTILREQWGFDGMTISDANAIAECVTHGVAADRAGAAKQAIEAGMDMDMLSNVFSENLESLIQNLSVSENILDQAVSRVLRIKFELGLFEQPYRTNSDLEKKTMLKPEHRALAREAAVRSMVLLKNDGVLPLAPGTRVGLVGALAENRGEMTGSWAIKAVHDDCVSLVDACLANHIDFVRIEDPLNPDTADCDVYIAAVGESKAMSGEAASCANIELPGEQIDWLKALQTTGKPVVAVLFNGRPIAIPWLADNIPAILEAWHPGVEAGSAILDILFGRENPSGKLTVTFPQTTGQCPMYYDHLNTGRPAGKSKFTSKYLDAPSQPVFPFGFGLSYTHYEYSDLTVTQTESGLACQYMFVMPDNLPARRLSSATSVIMSLSVPDRSKNWLISLKSACNRDRLVRWTFMYRLPNWHTMTKTWFFERIPENSPFSLAAAVLTVLKCYTSLTNCLYR